MAEKLPSKKIFSSFLERVVTIAHVGPITGPVAHAGKDNENGARLAIEDLNKKGLIIGGKKVHFMLQAEDDASDPKQAAVVAQKIVDAKAHAVIGHMQSGTSIPASKIYFNAGVIQIAPSVTSTKYTSQGFNTTFRMVANDAQIGRALANYAANTMHVNRIAVIDDRTAYGQGMADEFVKNINAHASARALEKPLNIILRQYTSDRATDFRSILTSIKKQDPDLIFLGGVDATAAGILKQMKELAVPGKLMGGDAICTTMLPLLANKALGNGQVICAQAGGINSAYRKRLTAFNEAYKKRFHQEVIQYAPYSYDAVMAVASAMQNAGSIEPKSYLPELLRIRYDGITGLIRFDAQGDILGGGLTLYTFKNGHKTVLDIIQSTGGGVK